MISRKEIERIRKRIIRQFPEFKGIKPKVSEKLIKPQDVIYRKLSLGTPKQLRRIFSLKFKKKIETVDQVEIERILTVTINEQGKVVKITESR